MNLRRCCQRWGIGVQIYGPWRSCFRLLYAYINDVPNPTLAIFYNTPPLSFQKKNSYSNQTVFTSRKAAEKNVGF